jgi:hypothetical protein
MTDDEDAPDPWAAPDRMKVGTNYIFFRSPPLQHAARRRQKTYGSLRKGKPAFVYVAAAAGLTKVGVTSDPIRRAKEIGASMAYVLAVTVEAAKDVEEVALRKLGRTYNEPEEWVIAPPDAAISAVQDAWREVSRYRRVDPAITEEDARRQRIGVARAPGI